MSHVGSVTHLLQQLKAGEEAALGKLVERFWPFLLAQAGDRLPAAVRRAANEEDVAQQVVWDFYQGFEDGSWQRLANRQDLVALLSKLTRCKAINQLKRELAKKRGGGGVQGEEALQDAAGSSLSPEEKVLQDEWCRVQVESFGPELRPIVERLLAGETKKEIAAAQRCSLRTVERKIARIQAEWLQRVVEP
jgi:DNA-directed RNA polymerase specialized sigma24 family protein